LYALDELQRLDSLEIELHEKLVKRLNTPQYKGITDHADRVYIENLTEDLAYIYKQQMDARSRSYDLHIVFSDYLLKKQHNKDSQLNFSNEDRAMLQKVAVLDDVQMEIKYLEEVLSDINKKLPAVAKANNNVELFSINPLKGGSFTQFGSSTIKSNYQHTEADRVLVQ